MDSDEKQLEELIALRDRMTTGMAKETDLEDVLKLVLKVIDSLKEQIEAKIEDKSGLLTKEINDAFTALRNIENKLEKRIKDQKESIKDEIDNLAVKFYKALVTAKDEIKEELPPPTDLTEINNRISAIENEPEEPEETGDDYINKINEAEGVIDRERVEGLEEEIKKLREEIKVASAQKGGVRRVYQPHRDDFSGQTDGATKSFGLTREPLSAETVMVFGTDFPIILRPTIDFTVTGRVITLTDQIQAPSQGATLIVFYFA